MKAITIKQPWATLLIVGEKKFETRGWKTNYRGEIAIHAGKSIDTRAYYLFKDILRIYGIETIDDLPTGEIIGTCYLENCYKVIEDNENHALLENGIKIKTYEYLYGDFSLGRYAWEVKKLNKFKNPIKAKGQLRLWDWN